MALTEFLLARVAEDEDMANLSGGERWDRLPTLASGDVIMHRVYDGEEHFIADCNNAYDAEHVAHWCPARVSAECKAKREMVHAYQHLLSENPSNLYDIGLVTDHLLESVLKPMAAVYADHPDYRQEWAL